MPRRLPLPLVLLAALGASACLAPIERDGDACGAAAGCEAAAPAGDVVALAAGAHHACALDEGGALRCWGGAGLAGDGTRALRPAPVAVRGLGGGVLALAAGAEHTCAVVAPGSVACWGRNGRGQLGDGTTADALEPVPAAGLEAVVQVVAGSEHTCALTAHGHVWCWGANDRLQLGAAGPTQVARPQVVPGLPADVSALAAGATHTCALSHAAGVWCWGSSTFGELGDGVAAPARSSAPVAARGLPPPVVQLAGGAGHTCARSGGGALHCWGSNATGALGDDTALDQLQPVAPRGLDAPVQAVRAGWGFTCAVVTDGALRCWGANAQGQLGDGTRIHRAAPVAVAGAGAAVGPVVDVAAGRDFACALGARGAVACWGANAAGQLGDGSVTDRAAPVRLAEVVR